MKQARNLIETKQKIREMLISMEQDYKDTIIDMKKRNECKCQYPYITGYFQGYKDSLKALKNKLR